MRHSAKIQIMALIAMGVVALSGCTSPAEPSKPAVVEPSIGSPAAVASVESVALPMDAYGLSADQKILDAHARDLLIRDCMRKAGATWQGNSAATTAAINSNRAAAKAIRFGLVDSAIAGQYGYHGKPFPPTEANGARPLDECVMQAKLKMGEGAPPAEEFTLSFDLPAQAHARTVNDSRYIAMTERWSACMADKGYQFETPEDAAKDSRWPTETATAKEIQAAVADVKCKKEVGYLDLVVALRTAYELQLIEEHSEVMQRLKEYYDKRVRLVTDMIAGNT
ncbi:hypothetical protein [Catellatospora vulcania]|uniref:hypothetical protein n=1 Tax=Catellatospora vulcania TaxID=1460450 RepID=UPI0012D48B5E|nr:hypothetical protein [Catellatospora vulcania]